MAETERQLAAARPRVSRRVAEEFSEFYRAEVRDVIAYILTLGGLMEEAKDAASAGMTALLADWDGVSQPKAYVRKAAMHHFIKERQRDRKLQQRLIDRQRVTDPHEGTTDTETDGNQYVLEAIKSLPPAQKQVMALTFDGLTPTEIARHLGKTPEAVRQNLLEARRRLQRQLSTPPDTST